MAGPLKPKEGLSTATRERPAQILSSPLPSPSCMPCQVAKRRPHALAIEGG